MRQSQLFTKTIKEIPKDETSFNAQMLMRAGFIDKVSAGVYTMLPLGLRVLNNIKKIIREEMALIDGQEILMPALTPKDAWMQTDRWESFDVLFKLVGGDKKEYALGATHEEIITPLAKKYLFSYKDLPKYIYQIQTKFRNELRAKAGLLRGREFSMKDLYSFHTNQQDLDEYYEKATHSYMQIFERCGLGGKTYLTFASGGAFSKYSHEFQTAAKNGEDVIYICEHCNVAINREIINEQKVCPECGQDKYREEKAIEVGNIFKLGNRFSAAFGMQFTDEAGEKKDVIMGCYGMGPSRIMGTIVEVLNDERGIVWPKEVAPFTVSLIVIDGKQDSVSRERADRLYEELTKNHIEVLYDDRKVSAGEKFADADLIGCPFRVVVSEKTLASDSVEVKKRNKAEAEMVKSDEIINWLKK